MTEEPRSNPKADTTIKSDPVPYAPNYEDQSHKASTWTHNKRVENIEDSPPIFSAQSSLPPSPPSLMRESAARERVRQRHIRGKSRGGEWAWVIIAVAMLGVVVTISMTLFFVLRNSQAEQEVLPTAVADLSTLPTPANFRTDALAAGSEEITLVDGSSIILEPWDGQSRFTILVMGLDRRPGETGLSYRTDTMMLVSLAPQTQQLGILSIPRDLYVVVPGYSQLQRINTPMFLGEIQQPGFGPRLAMETVQYNLGIRVHEYLAVDFQVFIDVVEAIGGVEVTTNYVINDPQYPDMYYGYDPFYLPAGTHQLNGYDALRFARTRHGDSDFERAGRQQEVIFAIRDKILNFNMLTDLIFQAPSLLNSWENNAYTGLNLDQMIRLAWYLKDIPSENISTGVIDYNYSQNYTTPDGAAVLIPDRNSLGGLLVEVFGANYSQ